MAVGGKTSNWKNFTGDGKTGQADLAQGDSFRPRPIYPSSRAMLAAAEGFADGVGAVVGRRLRGLLHGLLTFRVEDDEAARAFA